jgi:hypothetical protein
VVAEQHDVDQLAPGREGGLRSVAGLRVRQLRDLRAERDDGLGDERRLDQVLAPARDRGGMRRMGVDDRADIGPALVDREVKADLAKNLAGADHVALAVDLDEISLADDALGRRRRRRDVAIAVARGDVAIVVGDPAGGVQVLRGLGDRVAKLFHGAMSN